MIGCSEGAIRLVGGVDLTEGRVEICFNDEWGTVCDQMWDVADAAVVCRQLGLNYTGKSYILHVDLLEFSTTLVLEAQTQASFDEGTGRIWLDNVQCTGSERTLMNCTASFNETNTCTHAQDAGVSCLLGI